MCRLTHPNGGLVLVLSSPRSPYLYHDQVALWKTMVSRYGGDDNDNSDNTDQFTCNLNELNNIKRLKMIVVSPKYDNSKTNVSCLIVGMNDHFKQFKNICEKNFAQANKIIPTIEFECLWNEHKSALPVNASAAEWSNVCWRCNNHIT